MLSAHELAEYRSDVVATMWDACVVQTYAAGTDTYGETGPGTYSDGAAIACGFAWGRGERPGMNQIPLDVDATLRLSVATVVTANDRIKLTKRYEAALSPELVFSIVGPIEVGLSALVLRLKRVTA